MGCGVIYGVGLWGDLWGGGRSVESSMGWGCGVSSPRGVTGAEPPALPYRHTTPMGTAAPRGDPKGIGGVWGAVGRCGALWGPTFSPGVTEMRHTQCMWAAYPLGNCGDEKFPWLS